MLVALKKSRCGLIFAAVTKIQHLAQCGIQRLTTCSFAPYIIFTLQCSESKYAKISLKRPRAEYKNATGREIYKLCNEIVNHYNASQIFKWVYNIAWGLRTDCWGPAAAVRQHC